MTIPDYQSIMLPLLHLLKDRREHARGEVIEAMAAKFRLDESDRKELLPSGKQPVFENRVGWARTYLKKAGLIESPERSSYRITSRGLEVLATNPTSIDRKVLMKFPEFREFQRGSREQGPLQNGDAEESRLTPEETLGASYQSLRGTLALELLERVKQSSPQFFEKLVIDLLVAMGYGGSLKDAGQAIGRSGDGGIDGIIKEDRLGLDVVYVQAKRWDAVVGRPVVQGFAGSLEGQRARKGVLITTSQFSQEARDFVTRIERKIVLIGGEQLAQYMIDYGVGVAEVASYTVKKVDLDYFGDEQ